MTDFLESLCNAPIHPQAAEGLRLFNTGEYFEAHEALEVAWLEEPVLREADEHYTKVFDRGRASDEVRNG